MNTHAIAIPIASTAYLFLWTLLSRWHAFAEQYITQTWADGVIDRAILSGIVSVFVWAVWGVMG